MANRVPLVFDATQSKIKELPSGDNLELANSSIVDVINITGTGIITTNTVNTTNLNVDGNAIAEVAKTNDYNDLDNLPTLFSGDYNDLTNAASGLSADWADITNKPSIATKLSQLVNDTNFVTNAQVTIASTQVSGLAAVATGGSYTDLIDANQLVTKTEITGGSLTIDVNNTGDLEGSVYSADGNTLLVDGVNKRFIGPLTGDVTGNVTGDTTGIHNGDVYSQDGTVQVLYAGTSSADAVFRGNVSGQLYTVDDSTLSVDANGNHFGNFFGDFKGSVFGDDSSVIVDAVNNAVEASDVYAGTVWTTRLQSQTQLAIEAGIGMALLPTGDLTIPNAANVIVSASDTIVLDGSSGVALNSVSGDVDISSFGTTTVQGDGYVVLQSGPDGTPADMDVTASTLGINADATFIGLSKTQSVSAANAMSFTLPVYADATARDAAITSPEGGMLVYITATGKFTGYNDQTTSWDDLN